MRKFLLLPFLVLSIIGITSCESYTIQYPEVEYDSFSTSVQPLLDQYCVSCHSGGSLNLSEGSSFVSLSSGNYINTDDPESSKLYQVLMGSHADKLNPAEDAIILAWIQAGAPND